ncbi:MAG: (d)CMP kinase [Lachnospiraceae bacterium]|nr:(d)CMP kinase [Lachnospiraceae bacterium]
MNIFAIAIDGPAGSGKSTVAKKIAGVLNIVYIDTGAMYRSVALYCINKGISTKDGVAVSNVLHEISLKIELEDNRQIIFLNGENVTLKIRTQEIGQGASDVGTIFTVREYLVGLQRELAKNQSVVMDGRDIGTNVLPDAKIKIYLSADVKERAKRRQKELDQMGISSDLEEIETQIKGRDFNDMNRKYNPLRKADDAIEVDTTHMTIDEVCDTIINITKARLKEME